MSYLDELIEVRVALDDAINKWKQMDRKEEAAPSSAGRKLVWGARVSADFRASVLWIEQELGLNADYLMACMAFETGVTFSPSKKNPASTATGLIQFMAYTAKNLGTTTQALAKMTAVKQLAYVYRYFKQFGKDLSKWDLGDTYMAILLPSMIGDSPDKPMEWNAEAYRVNKGLDKNKDGVVTKAEAVAKVQALYELGSQKENMA